MANIDPIGSLMSRPMGKFRVPGSEFRVPSLRFSGLRVQVPGLTFLVSGFGLMVLVLVSSSTGANLNRKPDTLNQKLSFPHPITYSLCPPSASSLSNDVTNGPPKVRRATKGSTTEGSQREHRTSEEYHRTIRGQK